MPQGKKCEGPRQHRAVRSLGASESGKKSRHTGCVKALRLSEMGGDLGSTSAQCQGMAMRNSH